MPLNTLASSPGFPKGSAFYPVAQAEVPEFFLPSPLLLLPHLTHHQILVTLVGDCCPRPHLHGPWPCLLLSLLPLWPLSLLHSHSHGSWGKLFATPPDLTPPR